MRQKRIIIYIISSLIGFFYSCSSSSLIANKEFRDIEGKPFKLVYFKTNVDKAYYVTHKGRKIAICNNPEEKAVLFNDTLSFQDFVNKELRWTTNKDVEGKVYIALLIDKNGKIREKRVVKEIDQCHECTVAALNLVDKIEPIKAAMDKGHSVNSISIIYIPFSVRK